MYVHGPDLILIHLFTRHSSQAEIRLMGLKLRPRSSPFTKYNYITHFMFGRSGALMKYWVRMAHLIIDQEVGP